MTHYFQLLFIICMTFDWKFGLFLRIPPQLRILRWFTRRHCISSVTIIQPIGTKSMEFNEVCVDLISAPNSTTFVSNLRHLARLYSSGFGSVGFSDEQRVSVLSEIDTRSSELESHGLTECLRCLGLLKFNTRDRAVSTLTNEILQKYHQKTLANSVTADKASNNSDLQHTTTLARAKSVSSMLSGLVHTGWKKLPPNNKEIIFNQIRDDVFLSSIAEISNSDAICISANSNATSFAPSPDLGKYVADVVWSLGKLKVDWRSLPESLKLAMVEAVSEVAFRMSVDSSAGSNVGVDSSVRLSRILYGLSQIGVQWKHLADSKIRSNSPFLNRGSIKSNILSALSSCVSPETTVVGSGSISGGVSGVGTGPSGMTEMTMVNILYALGKMECSWTEIAPPTAAKFMMELERMLNVMGPAAVANTIW